MPRAYWSLSWPPQRNGWGLAAALVALTGQIFIFPVGFYQECCRGAGDTFWSQDCFRWKAVVAHKGGARLRVEPGLCWLRIADGSAGSGVMPM